MARDGAVPAFHSVAADATVKRAAAERENASVSRVTPGPPPPSAGRAEESGDTDFLLRFFDLKRNPFPGTPEEGVFCSNAAIRQVYRELITALCERSGAALLTGEAGVGKTTLLRRLCSELKAAGHLVIARYRAGLHFSELVAVVAEEIRVPSGNDGDVGFPIRLREQLERNKCGRPPVLIIDDAERLGGDVIKHLGQLLVGPADRSLRILLCGRPELAKRLELPVLADLRAMVLISHRLERLDDDDAASYIFHRLRAAGYRGSELFLSAAINTVVAKAGGLPRQIDRLCTKSLTLAAATGIPFVTSEIVEQAARELSPKGASPIEAEHDPASVRRYRTAIAGSMGAGIVVAVIALYAGMGRGQAPEVVEVLSAPHAMAPSWEGTAFTRQAAAMPPQDEAALPESKSGRTELMQLRLQEAPQLAQAVQWAFDEPDTSPRPAALEPASPNLLQPAGPCREAVPALSGPGHALRPR